MGTIITVSGVPGSGKTTLTDYLLSFDSQYCIVPSVTTRPPRERDHPGEFLHISLDEFNLRENANKFLWVAPPIRGVRYGTLRKSVGEALGRDGVSLMVITVEYLQNLRDYAAYNARSITGLYILSPGEAILRERLTKRGDTHLEIEKRLNECRDWDSRALEIQTQPSIRFIHNDGSLDDFFAEATKYCPH